jgi:hypothetical protein
MMVQRKKKKKKRKLGRQNVDDNRSYITSSVYLERTEKKSRIKVSRLINSHSLTAKNCRNDASCLSIMLMSIKCCDFITSTFAEQNLFDIYPQTNLMMMTVFLSVHPPIL